MLSLLHRSFQARKESTKIDSLGPEAARWGGGLPRAGVGVKKFVPSLVSQAFEGGDVLKSLPGCAGPLEVFKQSVQNMSVLICLVGKCSATRYSVAAPPPGARHGLGGPMHPRHPPRWQRREVRQGPLSGTDMTGRPGYRTMEMIGGSSAPYLARTPCVPLFCTSFNRVGNKERF